MSNKSLKADRESFIKAASSIQSNTTLALSSFITRHKNSTDTFNLSEALQTLSKKQHEIVWTALFETTQDILKELGANHRDGLDDNSPSLPALLSKIHCIASIIQYAVTTLERIHPRLEETTSLLHSLLLTLPQSYHDIADIIAKICFHWWKTNMADKQRFYPNLITYMLVKSQQAKGSTVQLIKDIYSIRKGLLEMNISDDQCEFLKPFFLKLFASRYQLLKNKDCSKFLSFLFSIHPSLNLDFHLAILQIVPTSEKKVVEIYGNVYFHAWKISTGVCREKLEYACIQDLLYKGILAHRTGPNAIFNTVFLLVSTFFTNKHMSGVEEMLYRLFKPFLWRFLICPNHLVRTNAAIFFFSSFPIQDPDMPRQELDETLQKQFDIILDLIMDPSPQVRNNSITSSFKLLSGYWQFFPGNIKKSLLTRLVSELSIDVNSVAVRVSVINGLARLLENNLSHPALEPILPILCNHIHDVSELVRSALVDLLIKIKHLNTHISFLNIVPVEHLLARIELDSSQIVMKIVALLMSSFLPVEKSGEVQMTRVVSMLNSCSMVTARKFYSFVHCYMTPLQIIKFINLTTISLKNGVLKSTDTENMSSMSNQSADLENISIDQDNDSLSQSFIDNPSLMQGLLEITGYLWYSALDVLTQSEHEEIYGSLINRVSQLIPLFFNAFADPQARSAVLLLASLIPPDKIPVLSYNPIEMLSLYNPDSPSENYLPLLICIVRWNQGKILLGIFLHNIECLFENTKVKSKSKKKSEPKFSFEMTFKLLEATFENPPTLKQVKDIPEFVKISKALGSVTNSIETFITRECNNTNLTIPLLLSAFRIHCKILTILAMNANENSKEIAFSTMERLVTCLNWAKLLPPELAIAGDITEIRVTSRRKRKNMHGPSEVPLILPAEMQNFILSLINDLIPLTADLTLLGLRDIPALEASCLFNLEVARVNKFTVFYNHLMKFVYNLIASFDYEDNLSSFGEIWGYCCQILELALKLIQEISMTKSLPKHETSLLSHTIEIGVKYIDRLKTNGSEESILNTSRVNVHAFIISLSQCINSVLLESIEAHLISNNLSESKIEIRPEVLPEFQVWLSKLVRKKYTLKMECIYQLEAISSNQSTVRIEGVMLCKKLLLLEN
ncbi:Condensin-2 complex subunit G2 [Oopsacas minuta]|uniref:Condensin-2 complex subunit G2 n=1 Tax=Oopsacas minuta TaxID=111878 RepID=A0AAV7KCZ9_9METZ|nr:Condensin-2 complex subunit G2 [Oopsacas minuta]